MTKKIRIDILIKKNKTLNEKKRGESCHYLKETETKIVILNTYKTREIIIYKRLSRRLIL